MISEKTLLEKSAFFAKVSNFAYRNTNDMKEAFPEYHVEYYGHKGADAYTLENDTDMIIACRGTEVKQIADVKADLSISKTSAKVGKIHIGFNHYVDKIWSGLLSRGVVAREHNRKVWMTGHSLGAAMATIIAYRYATMDLIPSPAGLFTYGSPRVGNRKFVNYFNTLPFEHHRWVNDGDIVTKIPFAPFFYHSGKMHKIDANGVIQLDYERTFNPMKLLGLTSVRGIWNTIMTDAKDHSSDLYRMHLAVATL